MESDCIKLITASFSCSQEVINLLIHGKALSNTFNNDYNVDNGHGLSFRNDIGFLSSKEVYAKNYKVGSYLKTPKYPIWIVNIGKRFSILFCLKINLMNDWKLEKLFDLYYFDASIGQDEQIKLTLCNL
jgi:ubiquitin carboxyl-terminal hydrolase MINDY-3/4